MGLSIPKEDLILIAGAAGAVAVYLGNLDPKYAVASVVIGMIGKALGSIDTTPPKTA